MRLLLDANLSPVLSKRLADVFPQSRHFFEGGDIAKDDTRIWAFAAANDFAIVSKDSDFQALSLLLGPPPKVTRLRIGNCTTQDVELLLRAKLAEVASFEADPAAALLDLIP